MYNDIVHAASATAAELGGRLPTGLQRYHAFRDLRSKRTYIACFAPEKMVKQLIPRCLCKLDVCTGNDAINEITRRDHWKLRVDLYNRQYNVTYAEYEDFWIEDETNNYRLQLGTYRGTAGDSLTYHKEKAFSTTDRKNNGPNSPDCANRHQGAWWFDNCLSSHLNGLNLNGRHDRAGQGVIWQTFGGVQDSLIFSEMKINLMT
ncbi:FIBCD1 [Cordylochernes scorpioides]|uniref:FIBCD1 n=1 Tax=Cordylochernes scorpioides TaxID=51811 RepID=A0ABY6K7M8_9ARAC|nr:FIBCD1 [Cordylochernes scorpioides]